jgi:PLP dependent protein
MTIADNLKAIRQQIPEQVQLVCVSKFHPDEAIVEAYRAGERVFGESKVQELSGKYERLPKDIHWHFIGHLQTNKIKYIVPFVELIHGVDSFRLLQEINKQAEKHNRVVNCLLQVHIASEETKFGFSEEELLTALSSEAFTHLKFVRICGVMGMATLTDDTEIVKQEFAGLKQLFDRLKQSHFATDDAFRKISMGMSDDFPLAIAAGSTMVRIGSSIFGRRNYGI